MVSTALPLSLAPAQRLPAKSVTRAAALPEPAPILPRVATGDEAALKECLQRYGNLVWSLALRFSRDARDAEDATQEIFVALWRSAGAFDASRASEATFVAMIARRRLIDRQRAPATRPLSLVTEEDQRTSPSTAESYVDARNAAEALSLCSEDQRRVILLSALSGLTHEEIARELGMPLGTVKSHYARGIERVKKALSRTREEP